MILLLALATVLVLILIYQFEKMAAEKDLVTNNQTFILLYLGFISLFAMIMILLNIVT